MSTPSNPTLPFDLDKLFQEARPELESVDSAQFVRRLVLRARAVELTDITLRSWAPLVEQLNALLMPNVAKQRKAELEQLHRRAWVFYAADLAAEELRADPSRLHQRALAKIVAEHDRFLFKWATPMFADHPVHGPTLRDISRGVGRRDDAEDVLRLVALFREHWEAAKEQVPAVTAERLDQAAADATEQLTSLAGTGAAPLRKLAEAAYALWHRDYDELMALGRYISRHEDDVLERFPGVRSVVTRRGNEELDEALDLDADADADSEEEESDVDSDADDDAVAAELE